MEEDKGLLGAPLVGQLLRLCPPKAGGLSLISGQETKFHMLQLRVHLLRLEID